jgi:tetratricopeptide (TPR) repeat protein
MMKELRMHGIRLIKSGVLLMLLHTVNVAQDRHAIDSLTALFSASSVETTKVLLNGEIAHHFSFFHPETAIILGKNGVKQAQEIGFKKGEAVNLNAMAGALFTQSNYREAWGGFASALKIAEELNDQGLIAKAYLNFGNISYYQNDKQRALEQFRKSLEIGERIKDPATIASASVNLGVISIGAQDYRAGQEYLFKASRSFALLNDKKGLSYCYRNIAITFQLLNDIDGAMPYLQRSLDLAEQLRNNEIISGCLQAFADIHRIRGEYEKSIEYGKRALSLAQQINDLPYVNSAATTLASAFEGKKDYRNALKYTLIARNAGDSILSNAKNRELQNIQHRFEMDGKQKEIDLLEQRSKNEQLLSILFATALGAVIVIAFVLFRNFKREKESKERLALINQEKQRLINDLTEAMDNIRTLGELLPICSNCKSIRDDQGYWQAVDRYISSHTDTKVSHGICPDCMKKLYPAFADRILKNMSAA